jgi:hypothetical protein
MKKLAYYTYIRLKLAELTENLEKDAGCIEGFCSVSAKCADLFEAHQRDCK